MAVESFTKAGAKASAPIKLDKSVFGLKVDDHGLLKEAYLAYLANGRTNLAKAKKRGQVRGGGAKPWRQKGTGRARVGSSRNPLWTGGGVAFGPTGDENYTKRLTTRSKRLALRQALSMAADDGRIKLIDSLVVADGKAKSAAGLLAKLKCGSRTLLVVDQKERLLERATANLSGCSVVSANYLNVFDIMNADSIVITKKSLEVINGWLSDKGAGNA
ncbi:MAG TPA: 50S ribosomal protein L4 [Candidatus Saccharimonadales bacterium]|nr:50S ribosomal protein L4 [Candidatus Saccharimonadales bacterium]